MGATAAIKLMKILDNLDIIIAIEFMNAAQALEFRRPMKSSPIIEKFVESYRKKVSFIEKDIVMYKEIEKTVEFLKQVEIVVLKAS
jgi:histidine ammonia-lyase